VYVEEVMTLIPSLVSAKTSMSAWPVQNLFVEHLPCVRTYREAMNANVLKDIVVIRSANVSSALEALAVVNPPTCKLATNANWQDVLQMPIAPHKKLRVSRSPEESATARVHPDSNPDRIMYAQM
jgi:hypothetical protein